jgi:hypothetical protein
MPARANPEDEAALVAYASALADAVDAALPGWVRRCVAQHVTVDAAVDAVVAAGGRRVQRDVGAELRALLALDLDDQRATPLALLRAAVATPTAILRDLGVPPVPRDEFEQRSFPDDVYRLTPATFADVDPSLQELGLRWGAAKAFVFKQRRRQEGRT